MTPSVLAFSCIYRAFGFLPSSLILTHYKPTEYTLFFLSYWLILTDWPTDRPTDRPTDWLTALRLSIWERSYPPTMYLYIANISYTRGVYESIGLSYEGPCSGVLWHYPLFYRGGGLATLWLLYIYKRDT